MGTTPPTGTTRRPRRLRRAAPVLAGLALLAGVVHLTSCMDRLFVYPVRAATEPPPGLRDVRDVWFAGPGGARLHGWLLPGAGEGPRPGVLHVHGNAGNVESHVDFTSYLAAAGFTVLVFDYRGYGRSEGRAAWRREALVADAHAALDALRARPEVDPDRVAVYGHSLGGAVGLTMLAERPEPRCAVIESGFASWRDVAGDALGWIGGPLAWLLVSDRARPEDAARAIGRPLLVVHGDADEIVPVEHGRRLAAAAGDGARLLELEGGGHNTLLHTHPALPRAVVAFLREHLEADPPGDP